jgi:glycosyltransferase involved in cell wall biosynthesis
MAGEISIVVPAYNAAATIDLCIGSLAGQRGPGRAIEVIVVDDCSTDDTAARVERLAALHAARLSLRLLRQPANHGPAAARNRGAQAATADIVIFTDADCELDPDWAAEMTAPLADPSIAAVKGAYRTRQTPLVALFAQAEFDERYRKLAAARHVDVLFSYSAAIRRHVFLEAGGFDASFPVADNEDTDFSWRIVSAGHRIVFNPRAIVYHRHPSTLAQYLRKKRSRAYWRVMVYRRFPGKALHDSYTPQTLKVQIGLVALAAPAAVLGLFWSPGWALLAVFAACFVVSALPFLAGLRRTPLRLMIAAPFLLVARAAAMLAGLLRAAPGLFRRSPLAAAPAPMPRSHP